MESHQYFTGSYKKGCIMQKFPFLIHTATSFDEIVSAQKSI